MIAASLSRLGGLRLVLACAASLTASATFPLLASDWPQLRGPNRDGHSPESIRASIPKDGAPVLWKTRLGSGYSGPVVARGKVIVFHRRDGIESLDAYDAASGKPLWKCETPANYVDDFGFDDGPRATPVVDGDRVVALGADGHLLCASLTDGKKLWEFEARKELDAAKGYFGFACSPIVVGGRVLANLGGPAGAGIVAFDADTGKPAWKATSHEASYSSPIATTVAGTSRVLFFTREGLVGLDPANGKVAFEHPWRARIQASVNAAMPVLVDDSVLLSASYDTGAILLQLHPDRVDKIWSNDDSLSAQFASAVHHKGFLYGFHGRLDGGRPELRCVDAKSGKVLWNRPDIGHGANLLVGEELLVLTEAGEVLIGPASAKEFKPRSRFQAVGNGARAHPAFANGRLYARDKQSLACLDLAP